MAIKERKQITGTTAQIDAYEGHEGQIVWDKEKKTFVGMSGTAGKNYPLAPKEYVDNKVAKCLPLTGGTLTGLLAPYKEIFGLNRADLHIGAGSDYTEGGCLVLRTKDTPNYNGGFELHTDSSKHAPVLSGKPNGNLIWGGRPVVYLIDLIKSSSSGVAVRYSDGVQICCWSTHANAQDAYINYPLPFAELWASLVDHATALSTDWSTTVIHIRNSAMAPLGHFSYFAIGRWK